MPLFSVIFNSWELFIHFSNCVSVRHTTVNWFYFQEVVYLQSTSFGTSDNRDARLFWIPFKSWSCVILIWVFFWLLQLIGLIFQSVFKDGSTWALWLRIEHLLSCCFKCIICTEVFESQYLISVLWWGCPPLCPMFVSCYSGFLSFICTSLYRTHLWRAIIWIVMCKM